MSGDVFVYDAVRTPRGKGKRGGALDSIGPHDLIAQLVDCLRERHGADAIDSVSRLALGCVGQVKSQGGHIALVSRLVAKLPESVVATSVNNYCVSSLTAIGGAAAMIAGGSEMALAGGVEMMSQVPFLADGAAYYTDPALSAELRYVPVALAADLLATAAGFSRQELDAISIESHRRAAAAWESGAFAGAVVPVRDRAGAIVLDRDESVRPGLDPAALAALPPAFAELGASGYDAVMTGAAGTPDVIEHRHSIANCPPMSDGAALVLIGGRRDGVLRPRAQIRAFAEASADPIRQLTGGLAAMEKALAGASMELGDVEIIEFMEAFAALPLLFLRDFAVDPERVNVEGGHLAMGHPMGATGAILVSQLLDVMERREAATGLVVAHGASGVGAAMILERLAA